MYTQDAWQLLVVTLLRLANSLTPLPLANARLIVRCHGFDVLHDRLNRGACFVAIAVHCVRLAWASSRGSGVPDILTSSLQKNGSAREDTALQPGHAITKVVQSNFLSARVLAGSRNGNFTVRSIRHGHLDHGAAAAIVAARSPGAAALNLDLVVAQILLEELATGGARRWALHLAREVATREHRRALAERVRDLLGVDTLQRDTDTKATATFVVFDQDELALLGLRDIGEETLGVLVLVPGIAGSRDSSPVVGGTANAIMDWRHGGSRSRIAGVRLRITVKNLGGSDVIRGSRTRSGRGLVVVVVGLVHVFAVPCSHESGLAREQNHSRGNQQGVDKIRMQRGVQMRQPIISGPLGNPAAKTQ